MNTILFSDYDHTLNPHTTEAEFEHNLAAVHEFRQAGNQVCLTTGRTRISLEQEFPDYPKYCDYLMLDNGTVCLDYRGQILFEEVISHAVVKSLTEFCQTWLGDDEYLLIFSNYDGEFTALPDRVTKFRCILKDSTLAPKLVAALQGQYQAEHLQYFTYIEEYHPVRQNDETYNAFFDVCSATAGKEQGIVRLCQLEDLHSRIVTVGDSINDLGMIRDFDGYAIKNSSAAEQVSPDHIVASVAELIERIGCA